MTFTRTIMCFLFLFINTIADEWVLESNSITESMRPFLGNGYMSAIIAGEGLAWTDGTTTRSLYGRSV